CAGDELALTLTSPIREQASRSIALTSPSRIIGRLARDCDVVDVAFGQTRIGDPDELCAFLEVCDRGRARVAHRRLHSADQMMDDLADGSLVRHLALDSLRYQL